MNIALGFANERAATLPKAYLSVMAISSIANPPQFVVEFMFPHGQGTYNDGSKPFRCNEGDVVELVVTDSTGVVSNFEYDALTYDDVMTDAFSMDIGSTTFPTGTTTAKARLRRDGTPNLYSAWSDIISFTMPSTSASTYTPLLTTNVGDENLGYGPFLNLGKVRGNTSIFHQLTVDGVNYDGSGDELYDTGNGVFYVGENFELVASIPDASAFKIFNWRTTSSSWFSEQTISDTGINHTLKWDGTGVSDVTFGSGVTNISKNIAGGTVTFDGYNFINMALDTGVEDMPTNIRIYETAMESELESGKYLDSRFKDYCKRWDFLRLLSVVSTNDSDLTKFNQWCDTGDAVWGDFPNASGRKSGWPIKVIAELGNDTDRTLWVTVPHQITDSGCTDLASALNTNLTRSGLKLIVEYTNEYWNTDFEQWQYTTDQAAADTGTSDQDEWYGYRAAQIMDIFRTVFGSSSGSVWRGLLAGQLPNTGVDLDDMINGANKYVGEDTGISALTDLFYYLSTSNYFGNTVGRALSQGSSTLNGLAMARFALEGQEFYNEKIKEITIDTGTDTFYGTTWGNHNARRANWDVGKSKADGAGLEYIAYEGGTHWLIGNPLNVNNQGEIWGPLLNGRNVLFNESHQAAVAYDQIFQDWVDNYGTPCQFLSMSAYGIGGCWGSTPNARFMCAKDNAVAAACLGVSYRQDYRPLLITLTAS